MITILKSIDLAPYTTFKIGGKARYLSRVKTISELKEAIVFAKSKHLNYFLLGWGSNVLISDRGFDGLVIKIELNKITIFDDCLIEVEAGTPLSSLVNFCLNHNLSGIEFLVGIPGTLGGAVWGNAGIKNKAIGELVREIKILDNKLNLLSVRRSRCDFSYRNSRFKKNKEIIVSAVIKLKKTDKAVIENNIKNTIKLRKDIPKGKSAGCIFTNPNNKKAGLIIDKLGLKGTKVGDAMVSDKHANFIINENRASSEDVYKLISLIKYKAKEKLGVDLKEEIILVGGF